MTPSGGAGDDGYYSTNKLGAIGADLGTVAAFFETPWSRLLPNLTEPDQAWLLNEAATRLRALGRLTEALEPMRAVLERDEHEEAWKEAAVSASNLSELEVTLGELEPAVADARRAIAFADRIAPPDLFRRLGNRTAAAAHHLAGETAPARLLLDEAQQIAERGPMPLHLADVHLHRARLVGMTNVE